MHQVKGCSCFLHIWTTNIGLRYCSLYHYVLQFDDKDKLIVKQSESKTVNKS